MEAQVSALDQGLEPYPCYEITAAMQSLHLQVSFWWRVSCNVAVSSVESLDMCRVKEHCIQRGLPWDDSLASTSCQEQDYYEDLLRFYRYNYRVCNFHNIATRGTCFVSRLVASGSWQRQAKGIVN